MRTNANDYNILFHHYITIKCKFLYKYMADIFAMETDCNCRHKISHQQISCKTSPASAQFNCLKI